MLRLRLLAAVAGALIAGLSVATIASARRDEGPGAPQPRDHTFGVGTFGPACWDTDAGPFCTASNFTVRLLGVRRSHDRAWGIFERRNNLNGNVFAGAVTCMTVEGNRASIGGWLTQTPGQQGIGVGDPFLYYVEDNGPPGSAPADRVSVLVALPPGDPGLSLVPDRFPHVCPSADSLFSGYAPLLSGDITVADQ